MQKLLTEKEAAKILNVSAAWLRQTRCKSKPKSSLAGVPFLKIGRMVRYEMESLDKFIQEFRGNTK